MSIYMYCHCKLFYKTLSRDLYFYHLSYNYKYIYIIYISINIRVLLFNPSILIFAYIY